VVGNEGIIGIALFMGGETIPNRAVVQSAGYAYRLKLGLRVPQDLLLRADEVTAIQAA
jgi:hypothetical protein